MTFSPPISVLHLFSISPAIIFTSPTEDCSTFYRLAWYNSHLLSMVLCRELKMGDYMIQDGQERLLKDETEFELEYQNPMQNDSFLSWWMIFFPRVPLNHQLGKILLNVSCLCLLREREGARPSWLAQPCCNKDGTVGSRSCSFPRLVDRLDCWLWLSLPWAGSPQALILGVFLNMRMPSVVRMLTFDHIPMLSVPHWVYFVERGPCAYCTLRTTHLQRITWFYPSTAQALMSDEHLSQHRYFM